MDKEFTPKTEKNTPSKVAVDPADDAFEIDPAELFDPEEFGVRRVASRDRQDL